MMHLFDLDPKTFHRAVTSNKSPQYCIQMAMACHKNRFIESVKIQCGRETTTTKWCLTFLVCFFIWSICVHLRFNHWMFLAHRHIHSTRTQNLLLRQCNIALTIICHEGPVFFIIIFFFCILFRMSSIFSLIKNYSVPLVTVSYFFSK